MRTSCVPSAGTTLMLGGGAVAVGLLVPAAWPAGLVLLLAGEQATRTTEPTAARTTTVSGREMWGDRGIRKERTTV
jgi:hypothetical protein